MIYSFSLVVNGIFLVLILFLIFWFIYWVYKSIKTLTHNYFIMEDEISHINSQSIPQIQDDLEKRIARMEEKMTD